MNKLLFVFLLFSSVANAANIELSTTAQNIGIGTVAQSGFKLDINGTARASSFVGNGSGAATMASNQGIGFDGVNATYTTPNLIINSSTGNVAINSTTANQKLEVAGTVKATAFIGNGSGLTGVSAISGLTTNRVVKASSSTSIGDSQITDNGTNVGIGSASPTAKLDVNGGARIAGTGGNVGIGTEIPLASLEVNGTFAVRGAGTSKWSKKTGANTACNTTCSTSGCAFGVDDTDKLPLACSDATADTCICMGP